LAKLTFACSHYRYSKGLKKQKKLSPKLTCRLLSFQKSKGRSLYSDLLPVLEKNKKSKGLRLQIRMQLLPVVIRVIRIKSLASAPKNQALVGYY
jgi:hypothetical protein